MLTGLREFDRMTAGVGMGSGQLIILTGDDVGVFSFVRQVVEHNSYPPVNRDRKNIIHFSLNDKVTFPGRFFYSLKNDPPVTFETIQQDSKFVKLENGLDLIIIQNFHDIPFLKQKNETIEAKMQFLKNLATDLAVPVLASLKSLERPRGEIEELAADKILHLTLRMEPRSNSPIIDEISVGEDAENIERFKGVLIKNADGPLGTFYDWY